MAWVDLHANLVHAVHSTEFLTTGHGLGLHVTLHTGTHSVGSLNKSSRRVGEQIGYGNLFNFTRQNGFQVADDINVFAVQFFLLLRGFFVVVIQLQGVLSSILDIVVSETRQRFKHDLVQGLGSIKNIEASGLEFLGDGRHCGSLLALSGDVVNRLLVLGHVLDVVLQAGVFLTRAGTEESQVFRQFFSVLVVFDNSYLQILSEVVPEHDVVGTLIGFVFGNITDHVQGFAHETLIDDGKNLGLLQDFTTDIQRKIVGIDDSLDELQPTGHQVLERIVDKDTLDVQPDVARVFVEHVLGQLKGEHARNVQNGLALDLSLQHEMGGLHGFVVTGFEGGFVKFLVFLCFDLTRRTQPDGFLVVDGFVALDGFRDGFHFWFFALS
mmetsp:Transcript_25524/g.54467  ORF Transcript_25524/g.54467 Transcript_25524/m.54467 type:complete len:382 (-) Transcript_25524:911-2056(-)